MKCIKESNLDDKLNTRLTHSCEVIPNIYGLPKIHKEGTPLKLIVKNIGSPTYELAKYVSLLIKPLVGNTDSFIKKSDDFIELIKNERVNSDNILVSFGVVSFLPKFL